MWIPAWPLQEAAKNRESSPKMWERGRGVWCLAVTCAGLWAAGPASAGGKGVGEASAVLEVSNLQELKLSIKY